MATTFKHVIKVKILALDLMSQLPAAGSVPDVRDHGQLLCGHMMS